MKEDEDREEEEEEKRPNVEWIGNFQRDLMAGAVMGGVVHTVVAPVERAKLLLQTQEGNAALLDHRRRRFRGFFNCIARTVRDEGVLSLWRGNGVWTSFPQINQSFPFPLSFSLPFLALSEPEAMLRRENLSEKVTESIWGRRG